MNSISPDSNKRPVAATVFAIIIIIQGALTLCCCVPLGLLGSALDSKDFPSPDYPQNYMSFLYGTALTGAVEVIYGLVAAVGLLMNKSWARIHTVIWAGLSVVTSLLFLVID